MEGIQTDMTRKALRKQLLGTPTHQRKRCWYSSRDQSRLVCAETVNSLFLKCFNFKKYIISEHKQPLGTRAWLFWKSEICYEVLQKSPYAPCQIWASGCWKFCFVLRYCMLMIPRCKNPLTIGKKLSNPTVTDACRKIITTNPLKNHNWTHFFLKRHHRYLSYWRSSNIIEEKLTGRLNQANSFSSQRIECTNSTNRIVVMYLVCS